MSQSFKTRRILVAILSSAFRLIGSFLDEAVPALLEEANVSGAAVGLVADGMVIHLEGYGFADRERAIPMTAETLLNVASVSKPVTAWGAMALVEEGTFELDVPASRYSKRFEIPESGVERGRGDPSPPAEPPAGMSLPAVPEYELFQLPPSVVDTMSGFGGVRLVDWFKRVPGTSIL